MVDKHMLTTMVEMGDGGDVFAVQLLETVNEAGLLKSLTDWRGHIAVEVADDKGGDWSLRSLCIGVHKRG